MSLSLLSDTPKTPPVAPAPDASEAQPIEFDALVKIVEMQAQALNDVINSANNLQKRVAELELAAVKEVAKSNGHGIISLH